MKIIIAGSRTFTDYEELVNTIIFLEINKWLKIIEIVSGGAKGADLLGERYAKEFEYKLKRFPVTPEDWNKFGRSAGILRNVEMAKYADGLIAFWDGVSRGTKHMIGEAKRKNLFVHIYSIPPNLKKKIPTLL